MFPLLPQILSPPHTLLNPPQKGQAQKIPFFDNDLKFFHTIVNLNMSVQPAYNAGNGPSVAAPSVAYKEYKDPDAWNTGLFDCRGDFGLAFETVVCTPNQVGRIYASGISGKEEKVNRPACLSAMAIHCFLNPLAGCFWPLFLRTKVRRKYNLPGSIPHDICVSIFLQSCSMCQMNRELTARGVPPGTTICPSRTNKKHKAASEATVLSEDK